jgi:hypothetical protein
MSLTSRLVRTGLRRGLLEGSRGWLYLGLAAGGVRIVRRLLASGEESIEVGELKPGETIQIRSVRRGS